MDKRKGLIEQKLFKTLEILDFIETGALFEIGDTVMIVLRKPYSKEELKDGCDPRVNGKIGTIENKEGHMYGIYIKEMVPEYGLKESKEQWLYYEDRENLVKVLKG